MKIPPPSEASWNEANRAMGAVACATLGFALCHSLLCSDEAKSFGRKLLGPRRGAGLYRAFFIGQSFVTAGALFAFILSRPHRTLYKSQGLAKWLGWAGQAAAIGVAITAFRDLDQAKFLGIQGVRSLREGEDVVEAEAQGPDIEEDGAIRPQGVYRFSRHPIEWAPVVLLLASPVMKTNWLAFDLLAAVYSYFGALQEEKRLLRESGETYAKYQREVAFFVGKPSPKA